MADNFVFYANWLDSIGSLKDRDKENELLRQIIEYGVNGSTPDCDDGLINMAFGLIKPQIDNAKSKYEAKIANGQTVGRKKSLDNEQIRVLARQGMKAQEIAAYIGVSTTAVYHSEGWKARNL